MTKEALKMALDALETELSIDWGNQDEFNASAEKMYKAIAAIKEALAQPEQECPNLKNCNGACFQCEYFNVETGEMEYPVAQPEQEPLTSQDIAALVEGMEVSIDVSTGEHDSGNRLFGVVDLVQENQGSKHDLILLVQEPKANFKEALAQPEQEPRNVRERWNVEFDGNDLLVCFNDHEKGDKCQYERYSPQRTWVGLTDDEMEATFIECGGKWNGDFWKIEDADFHPFLRTIEAKLKELNT